MYQNTFVTKMKQNMENELLVMFPGAAASVQVLSKIKMQEK